MSENGRCPECGGPLEAGYLSTSNGSGLFWSEHAEALRLRPHGMEVLVPTGFGGTYSANLASQRCRQCKRLFARLP